MVVYTLTDCATCIFSVVNVGVAQHAPFLSEKTVNRGYRGNLVDMDCRVGHAIGCPLFIVLPGASEPIKMRGIQPSFSPAVHYEIVVPMGP